MTTDKIVCPYCERSFDLDAVEGAEVWRERAEIAAKLGPLWGPANEYIECFRASRGARLSLKKRVRILGEIKRLWESGQFEYDGKRYRVSQADIVAGVSAVCNADKIGFQNHNYLKRVMLPQSGKLSAEGLTSSEEVVREQKRRGTARDGLFDGGEDNHEGTKEGEREKEEAVLSPEENARRARELAAGIGRKMMG